MCSLTIVKSKNEEISITMNRDERIMLEEHHPQTIINNNIKIISPKDLKSDGSWIGINEYGVGAFLLNRYDKEFDTSKNSRGEIITKSINSGYFSEIVNYLQKTIDYRNYNPFTLVIVDKSKIIRLDYNSKNTEIEEFDINKPFFATSSSWKENEVINFRNNIFEKWVQNPQFKNDIPIHHLPINGEDEKWTTFVQREKIHTKNICQINLKSNLISFKYLTFSDIINKEIKPTCEPVKLKIKN